EPRALALLATAYERPVEAHVLWKMRRACDLWNEGEKALAHIHLAYARLPPCDEERALRLFVADELIEIGVTPAGLMKAQGFDPAPLELLKAHYNPDQPRVPAGSGRESGEWTDGEASFTPVAFRPRRERHGRRGGGFNAIRSFLEWWLKRKEGAEPKIKPFESLESDLPRPGYGEEVSIPGLPDSIKGIDTTDLRARMPNYKLDMSLSEFEDELLQLGWTEEPSPDGKVVNFTKDGARYSVREFSDSTDGPTAEFFHPFSGRRSGADMKLRLRKD
ncbi:MAG: hypothetical protein ACREDT_14555, partial [Methylocella sp.]